MENEWIEFEEKMNLPQGNYVAYLNNGSLPRPFEVWNGLKVLEDIDVNSITHVMKLSKPI